MKWYRVVLDEAQFIRNRCVIQVYVSADATYLMLQGHPGEQSGRPTSCEIPVDVNWHTCDKHAVCISFRGLERMKGR
jgi:hypothetical protein